MALRKHPNILPNTFIINNILCLTSKLAILVSSSGEQAMFGQTVMLIVLTFIDCTPTIFILFKVDRYNYIINSTGPWTTGCYEWGLQSEEMENGMLWWWMQEVATPTASIGRLWAKSWGHAEWIYLFWTLCCGTETPKGYH